MNHLGNEKISNRKFIFLFLFVMFDLITCVLPPVLSWTRLRDNEAVTA